MSLVLSILLVLGLFALLGLGAWVSVAQISANLRKPTSEPSVRESPLPDARALVGQHAG